MRTQPANVRQKLSVKFIAGLKPPPPGARKVYYDTDPPSFGVRCCGTAKSYILYVRLPGSNAPTRLALGDAAKMDLAVARKKAREWLGLIEQGKDPRAVARAAQAEAQRKQRTTFAAVAEDFIVDKLPHERNGRKVERDIRRDLLPPWGGKPITEITDHLVRTKKAKAPAQARNLFGIARRLFGWAIDQRRYGLTVNPCVNLRASKMIGEAARGERILDDSELFALWRGAGRLGYPYREVYRLLILTGLRLNEVADANWAEFDLPKKEWVIPALRMKGRTGKTHPHLVPLTDDIAAILESLPRFTHGDYLFSSDGAKPIWMSSAVKARLDAHMRRTLRALARRRGDLLDREPLPRWTNHDIRRSVRTQLSRLKIPEEVREAVLAHARLGIKGVYDHYNYLDEKRDALQLWAARLRGIVNPQYRFAAHPGTPARNAPPSPGCQRTQTHRACLAWAAHCASALNPAHAPLLPSQSSSPGR